MADLTFSEKMKAGMLKPMVKMLDKHLEKDPEENIPKIVDLLIKYDINGTIENQLQQVKKSMVPGNNWYELATSVWSDINPEQRKKLMTTFVVNGNIIANNRANENREKYGCNIPWAILMDPTSACNLNCIGCWAADYGNAMSMDLETLDDIIKQGTELGTFFYIYSGGEPTVRKRDIIELCDRHPECVFLAFTNGTLFDDEFCDEIARVGNFVPAISVEGFGEATDARRGNGTFEALSKTMDRLRERKLAFGVSCCYTSMNTDVIGSEEYFDWMIEKGAKFAWFFTYMPVGVNASPDLMVSAEQRKFMHRQIRKFRETKPIFTMDFWNDGEYVHGCIAGGRNYLHINANGDIEPCAFIHYSDSNIHDTTLLEALQRPLFKAYQMGQPFNENMLRPCPLLDNPGALAEMVDMSGAKSTDLEHPEDVHELTDKCRSAAEKWAPVADEIWAEGHWEAHNPRGFAEAEKARKQHA